MMVDPSSDKAGSESSGSETESQQQTEDNESQATIHFGELLQEKRDAEQQLDQQQQQGHGRDEQHKHEQPQQQQQQQQQEELREQKHQHDQNEQQQLERQQHPDSRAHSESYSQQHLSEQPAQHEQKQDKLDAPSSMLQYQTFSSAVDASFWRVLAQKKLDEYKLSEAQQALFAHYGPSRHTMVPSSLSMGDYSFQPSVSIPSEACLSPVVLINFNTMESFKAADKAGLLQQQGEALMSDITSGRAVQSPMLLTRTLLLTYAMIKEHRYYYWFAFPAVIPANMNVEIVTPVCLLSGVFSPLLLSSFQEAFTLFKSTDEQNLGFFLVHVLDNKVEVHALSAYFNLVSEGRGTITLGFIDPCPLPTHPGWPLRNLLVLVAHCFGMKQVNVIGYRTDASSSIYLSVAIRNYSHPNAFHPSSSSSSSSDSNKSSSSSSDVTTSSDAASSSSDTTSSSSSTAATSSAALASANTASSSFIFKTVGWEKNKANKLGPRLMDLQPFMDPRKLAESSVDLNIKLMRWRALPSLSMEVVNTTKVLILGAGTLGCNVARCLLGWGIHSFTFVDNGKVSYSNPVRQSLYGFEDCLDGGKMKAQCAADSVRRIFPGVESQGVCLSIPMPGHLLEDSQVPEIRRTIQRLEALIDSHDVVFLLTDSRESRWLPSLLCAARNKLLMNTALGFDSYVVMRHGARESVDKKPELGCYFCNDVVAPMDSLRDRTLDQQCTVTRPGLAYIASALAVEMTVSLLHHPLRQLAPAQTPAEDSSSGFGIIPHQVRGSLPVFGMTVFTGHAFDRCTACSALILREYKEHGIEFLLRALRNPSVLEDISGLTAMKKETEALLEAIYDEPDDDF